MESYHAIARREAPKLGIPRSTLYRHLRHTQGDLAAAVQRHRDGGGGYAAAQGSSGHRVHYAGRAFRTRQEFTAYLADEFGLSMGQITARLYKEDWNVDKVVAMLRQSRAGAPGPGTAVTEEAPGSLAEVESATRTPASASPSLRKGSSTPVLYDGQWFGSMTALADHLGPGTGLSRSELISLMYEPGDEDLRERFEYFRERVLRCPQLLGDDRLPFIYRGQRFFSAAALARHLMAQFNISFRHASAIIFGLGQDVTSEVTGYCRRFGVGDGEIPDGEQIDEVAGFERPAEPLPTIGHAALDTEPVTADQATRSTTAAVPREVAEQLDAIGRAFEVQDECIEALRRQLAEAQMVGERAGLAAMADPTIARQLQGYNDHLERLGNGLRQLEKSVIETRSHVSASADMFRTILAKIGQIAHDLRLRAPSAGMRPPKHTRREPLGVSAPADELFATSGNNARRPE